MRYAIIGEYYGRERYRFILAVLLSVLGAGASIFFITFFVSSAASLDKYSYIYPTNNSITHISQQNLGIILSPNLKQLLKKINEGGYNSEAVSINLRRQFSVSGTLVTLGGDNITVFEYASNDLASKEAGDFVLRKNTHLYVVGSLVLYYFGQRSDIIETLGSIKS